MNKNINIEALKLDLAVDKCRVMKCESCERNWGIWLYVVQHERMTGIFHICNDCAVGIKMMAVGVEGADYLLIKK